MRTLIYAIVLLGVVAGAALADGIPIDVEFPSSISPPLPLPVYYQFRTSWDGIQWTEEQKDSTRAAFQHLGSYFLDQPAFEELASPDDFTIRWAGADFFKDWGGGWNFTGDLAIANKTKYVPPPKYDSEKYPQNEIYLNKDYRWHYNPFTAPEEGDPTNHTDGEFDFWSILLHESIHMLCLDDHCPNHDQVMHKDISDGEQRYLLKPTDLKALRDRGYGIVPEPGSLAALAAGLCILVANRRRRMLQ